MTRQTSRRILTAVALATVIPLTAGVSAQARPDAGPDRAPGNDHCELQRLGTQLVRCDDLTGNDVSAPLWIPVHP